MDIAMPANQPNRRRGGTGGNDESFKDAPHLLRIFPEEIWQMVLDQLTDPSDLENVCNASLFFRHLLIPKQTLFLFPKVWSILDHKHHQSGLEERPRNNSDESETRKIKDYYIECGWCKKFVAGWWNAATLNFRLVCRTWNSSVESFYQAKPVPFRMDSEMYPGEKRTCTPHNTCFKFLTGEEEENLDFMDHFDSTHYSSNTPRNPFPSRTVLLILSHDPEDTFLPPWNECALARLLQKYGHHIWHCDIFISELSIIDYSKTRDALGWMPNLKQLHIRFRSEIPSQNEIDEFTAHIISNPCPTLPFLQFLYADCVPGVMVKELISKSNKLQILHIVAREDEEEYDMRTLQLPKLQDLFKEVNTESEFLSLVSDQLSWPLKKLYLRFNDFIDWSVIFKKLEEKWADTLTTLALALPEVPGQSGGSKIFKKYHTLKLNFPGVTQLYLEFWNPCSLDCILTMKDSLEFLKLSVEYDGDENEGKLLAEVLENGQVIKLWCHSKQLWKSNVWILFPKLKRLQLDENFRLSSGKASVYTCTREDWNKKTK